MEIEREKTFKPYTTTKDEEYMNAEQLVHFKTILQSWQQEITENNNEAIEHLQDESATLSDPNDRASLEEEFSKTLKSRDRERKLVYKIKKSLERIDNDDFGFCEQCGEDIGLRRLEVRPTAELCIDCKEIQEKREMTK